MTVLKLFALFLGFTLFHTSMAYAEPPKLMISGILEGRMPNQYIVGYDLCTIDYRLQDPKIFLHSDMGDFGPFTLKGTIEPKNCGFGTATIKANDPETIQIELFDEVSKVEQMQKEITSLKEQLKAKDDIIKAQINVIMDLVSKIKSTIYKASLVFFS